jgi:HSP20 family protein
MRRKKDLVASSGPKGGLAALNRFNDLFEDLWNRYDTYWKNWDLDMSVFDQLQPKTSFPKINLYEKDNEYEIKIAVADFNKDDVELELKDNTLLVKGESKEDNEECGKCLCREISSRSFRRAVRFPKEIDAEKINCSYKDGVISCIIGKKEVAEEDDGIVKIKID